MDAVSYAHSAKQAKRIKKFIENPDSNSGVLTQPKVIEAGETVTIKSGRQAILADTVVDGDLVIEAGADVFIPAGAGFNDLDQRIDAAVKLTGNQTIEDVKTFTSSPIVPTPTTDFQVVNKAYVDSSTIPKGIISMWSGSIASIPAGWALCNGANETPDLRNRFIVGAGSTYGVGGTGGSADAVVVAHTHTGSTSSVGAHAHTFSLWWDAGNNTNYARSGNPQSTSAGVATTSAAGASTSSLTTNSTGVSGVDKNLPPYYALAYIMKT